MLALVLLSLVGQTQDYYGEIYRTREDRVSRAGGRGGTGYAFFEFAPASGAGMGAACACTTPSGAKGEALTFTRASNGTCTKTTSGGLVTTGIANGDLVVCSSNQPRVEYDSAGTLGLLVESARTNSALRSQELDNASWVPFGASLPTVTANYGTAPDGTLTAERIQVGACAAAASYSVIYQVVGATAPQVASIYLKSLSGTPTVSCCASGGGGGCTQITLSTSEWKRCVETRGGGGASTMNVGCNNDSTLYVGATNTGAADFLAWGAQVEGGGPTYATSYIPTTSAAANRVADTGIQATGVTLTSLASTGSSSATITPLATGGLSGGITIGASTGRYLYFNGNSLRSYDGTTEPTLASGSSAGVSKRYWTSWTGSTQSLANVTDSTTGSGAFDGTMATTGPLDLCYSALIGGGDYICSRVCLDPSPTRCR